MPAPWTRATNASASAGIASDGRSRSCGSSGVGSEPGTTPKSRSVATPPQPSTAAAADVRITATTSPSDLSGVRSSATISTIVATPMASDWACSSPGCASVLNARTIRLPPLAA
jgi:hypothetical protein